MKHLTRTVSTLVVAALLFGACKKDNALNNSDSYNSSNDIAETLPAVQTAVTTDVTSNIGGFYKALPARYDSTTKKYPLLIFLHGVGELGNGSSNLPSLLNNAVPRLLNQKKFPAEFSSNGKSFSFIVINPQFKAWPAATDVNAMINYAIQHYRIDTTRIYVAGLSMGGGATWDYAVAYANRIAAIVPICGASWPSQEQLSNIAHANLPVWAFHNEDDGTVSVNTTKSNVNVLNSFNPNPAAQMTLWATGGHDAWTKATNPATKECNGKNMYEWMLQYTRPVSK
ncbi:MAG: dienelactone hydrolase family protein [Bacteroidetes bacterium]|nr:dienelactone hydrolase family protein [Bacteroidota bacterium]